jgi:sterol desaturase/sphingolipid hydroxylase (fatty acid hydroxylase superfamily)
MERGVAFVIAALPVAMFVFVALAEWLRPRRALLLGRFPRWITNALFLAANRATVALMAWVITIPVAAHWAQANDFGLLNRVNWPAWAELLTAFILLDLAMWLQHLATHKIPILWRMHKVHHADRDMDVATAIRFHPFEIAVSTVWKAFCVAMLGVPALVALAFEAWLGANALFNHGNINLPPRLDRCLRPFLVTPDMHLVHHSTHLNEQQSNYGFALTIWDRLFGTYVDVSVMGRDSQSIGLSEAQDRRPEGFYWSIKLPFAR